MTTENTDVQAAIDRLARQGRLIGRHFNDIVIEVPLASAQSNVALASQIRRALRHAGYRIVNNLIARVDDAADLDSLGVDAVDGAAMSLDRFRAHLNEHAAGRTLLKESRVNEIVDGLVKSSSGSNSAAFSLSEDRADELVAMLENPHRASPSRQPSGAAFSLGAPRDRTDELSRMLSDPYGKRPTASAAFSLEGREPLRGKLFFDEAKELLTDEEFAELQALFLKGGEEKRAQRRARLLFIVSCLKKHHESREST